MPFIPLIQNLWELRGLRAHWDSLEGWQGKISRDEGKLFKWRWVSTGGTGEQEVVQNE